MKRKMLPNEKIDQLYSVISLLLVIILMLVFRMLGYPITSLLGFMPVAVIILPTVFRKRKQFKKIKLIKESLDISAEEMREACGARKYDLREWEKPSKVYITPKQMYILEDWMERKYLASTGNSFELKAK